jgi:hypothetical protein
MGLIALLGPFRQDRSTASAGTPEMPDKARLHAPDQVHMQPAAALPITNATEYGTIDFRGQSPPSPRR